MLLEWCENLESKSFVIFNRQKAASLNRPTDPVIVSKSTGVEGREDDKNDLDQESTESLARCLSFPSSTFHTWIILGLGALGM
jgi:hypothetical protein